MIRMIFSYAALAAVLGAQTPVLNGRFVLAEQGSATVSLGLLRLDASGAVTGTRYALASGVSAAMPVTGNYVIGPDGAGTLTLNTQVTTEDGSAPAVAAVYDFLLAKSSGFTAIRRDGSDAALATLTPAAAEQSLQGAYRLAEEGASRSGQKIARIGALSMKADGTLNGKLASRLDSVSETAAVTGTYVVDSSGFGTMRLTTPGTDDEGATVLSTTTYLYLVTSKGEVIAMSADNALLGLVVVNPAE